MNLPILAPSTPLTTYFDVSAVGRPRVTLAGKTGGGTPPDPRCREVCARVEYCNTNSIWGGVCGNQERAEQTGIDCVLYGTWAKICRCCPQ